MLMEVCIYIVKAHKIWVKDMMTKQKDQSWKNIARDVKNLNILL